MTRFINCDACQTEGRILTNDGGPDDVDHGVCPECNGECVVEVETRPIEMEDLAAMAPCQDCGQSLPLLYPCFQQECPSCKRMFETGGQCAAPVMRGGCPMGGDV